MLRFFIFRNFTSCKKKKCAVASFHPIQSFSKIETNNIFKDIFIGIEGCNKASEKGKHIAKKLQAHPFLINSSNKTLYHIACVFASNYLVALINASFELLHKSGIKEENFFKL